MNAIFCLRDFINTSSSSTNDALHTFSIVRYRRPSINAMEQCSRISRSRT